MCANMTHHFQVLSRSPEERTHKYRPKLITSQRTGYVKKRRKYGEKKEGTEKKQRRNKSLAGKEAQARRRAEMPPSTEGEGKATDDKH